MASRHSMIRLRRRSMRASAPGGITTVSPIRWMITGPWNDAPGITRSPAWTSAATKSPTEAKYAGREPSRELSPWPSTPAVSRGGRSSPTVPTARNVTISTPAAVNAEFLPYVCSYFSTKAPIATSTSLASIVLRGISTSSSCTCMLNRMSTARSSRTRPASNPSRENEARTRASRSAQRTLMAPMPSASRGGLRSIDRSSWNTRSVVSMPSAEKTPESSGTYAVRAPISRARNAAYTGPAPP